MPRSALFVLALALVAATGAQAAPPPVTAEALLAAGIPWATVRKAAGPTWWPLVPQFESPPFFRQPTPSRPFAVASQWYAQIGRDTRIQTTLLAFRGAPKYCGYVAAVDGVTVDARSPAVGASHAYWTASQADGSPATVFCFERGPVAVEIKVLGARWGPARIGLLARPVDANVQALLAGRLAAPALAAGALARLPAGDGAPGRVLGTAVLPAEAWASNAARPTPKQVLAHLARGGSRSLLFRRYVLGDRTNVVDVTLFSFTSSAAAKGWFRTLAAASSLASTELAPGATGAQAAFRALDDYYALDFVAGRAVADITCYAPYGETPSTACVAAARTLGERWYAQLARA